VGDALEGDLHALPEHAAQEGVHHDVAGVDAEPGEEALGALPGGADQDAAGDRLVLGRVLADHQHPGATVQAAAVEQRPHSTRKSSAG
jgi:hypothetical protein